MSEHVQLEIQRLLAKGISLHQTSIQLDCSYAHSRNFAHHHLLIDYRPHTTDPQLIRKGVELVRSGVNVHAAAAEIGRNAAALRTRARASGLVNHVSQYQRKINSTNLRVIYLRLRLASLSKKDAATATGIDYR